MTQYIDKDALVAEIERRLEAIANASNENNRELAAIQGAQQYELINLIQFLDTLEVKEVDLDNELDFVKDAYYYFTSDERSSMKKVAKHFFELGLSVSNKAQKGE